MYQRSLLVGDSTQGNLAYTKASRQRDETNRSQTTKIKMSICFKEMEEQFIE